MKIDWSEGYRILFRIEGDAAILSANREGLLSFADQLTVLANEEAGAHIHYNAYNSLEDGSAELIIEKI